MEEEFLDDISLSSQGNGPDDVMHTQESKVIINDYVSYETDPPVNDDDNNVFMDDRFSLDASIFGELEPPQLPPDWESKMIKLYDVKRGCPAMFKHVDNPGHWYAYVFLPKYKGKKLESKFVGHYLPTGATLFPRKLRELEY